MIVRFPTSNPLIIVTCFCLQHRNQFWFNSQCNDVFLLLLIATDLFYALKYYYERKATEKITCKRWHRWSYGQRTNKRTQGTQVRNPHHTLAFFTFIPQIQTCNRLYTHLQHAVFLALTILELVVGHQVVHELLVLLQPKHPNKSSNFPKTVTCPVTNRSQALPKTNMLPGPCHIVKRMLDAGSFRYRTVKNRY